MENEILSTIITLEREIQERLADEERRAALMLDVLREELEVEARREKERLHEAARSALTEAEREAEIEAEALLGQARAEAKELEDLDDAALETCLARHLSAILPERRR